MNKLRNLIPEDYRSCRGVYKVGSQYYKADKIGSSWCLGILHDAKLISMMDEPVTPWILVEFGEYVQYRRYERVLEWVTKKEVIEYLKNL